MTEADIVPQLTRLTLLTVLGVIAVSLLSHGLLQRSRRARQLWRLLRRWLPFTLAVIYILFLHSTVVRERQELYGAWQRAWQVNADGQVKDLRRWVMETCPASPPERQKWTRPWFRWQVP